MFKDLFHSKKKEIHPTTKEHCSFLKKDCVKEKCLFWVREFERIHCLNQKEAFAAALAMRELKASHSSLLEIFSAPQADSLKKLFISIDPRDALLFFESLLPEERVRLVHSLSEMDFKNSREKTLALANLFQMAAAMKKDSFGNFMKALEEKSLFLFQLFQRMDWWDYEDLQFLDDKSTDRWLREMTHEELWLALKLCGKNVKERIYSLITENAIDEIKTLNKEKGNPSKRKIKRTHSYILRLVIVLSESGEINPPLESYKRLLEQQKKLLPVSEGTETKKGTIEDPMENLEWTETICPLIHSGCAREKCLFWIGPSLSGKTDEGCIVSSFNGFLFSGKDDLKSEAREKLIPVLAGWLIQMKREEMKLVFAALREGVQAETTFWILSTIYPQYVESSAEKKQFFSEIMEELKRETPSKFEDKAFDPVSDILKPFLLMAVSEIIQPLPFKRRDSILSQIRQRDPDIYKDMKLYDWHPFDDLVQLNNRATQAWLKDVNSEDLLLAMKLCSDKLKQKILGNMSDRAAAMFAEDLRTMGPVRMSDVENRQKAILKVVRALMAEKKIKGWK